jgi:dsDNA-binding SOS-regulon protein
VSIIFSIFAKKHLKKLSHSLERLTMADNFVVKNHPIFCCETCDYKSSRKVDYEKHLKTKKHADLQMADKNSQKVTLTYSNEDLLCNCGKIFQHRQSLFKHRKKCVYKNEELTKNDLIKQLMIQNQQLIFENKEFKDLIIDQSNKMMELATKPTNIINNTSNSNNNNKQFNLNLFLNEKCKNAMNMSDFIDSIQIEDDDFEDIGKLGYIQGISNIFIKGLKDLDETVRPMHCSDIKRETLYIKDNNVWDKDENKKQVKHAIAMIAHKNFKYIPIWAEANPQALDCTTKKNDQYMRIANQVTTAITPDNEDGIKKIIRNIASKVCIEK